MFLPFELPFAKQVSAHFLVLVFASSEEATFEPQGPPELELNPVSKSNWSVIIPF